MSAMASIPLSTTGRSNTLLFLLPENKRLTSKTPINKGFTGNITLAETMWHCEELCGIVEIQVIHIVIQISLKGNTDYVSAENNICL